MTTAIRCELCPTIDGVKPLATCRCRLKVIEYDAWVAVDESTVELDLCESCRREAAERGDMVEGAPVEVL